jgi:adenosylcobinamide-GDP ribazoletransferase
MSVSFRLERQLFLLSLRYLTRVRVPDDLPHSDDLAIRATKYHPLVGALVGFCGGVVLLPLSWMLSPLAAMILAMIAMLLMTGAFHEIGLARAADVIGDAKTKDEARRLVEERPLRGYGVVSLVMVMALKLALLIELPLAVACMALVVSNAIGRMATVHVVSTTYLARDVGVRARVPGVTSESYWIALTITVAFLLLATVIFGPLASAGAFVGAVVLGQCFRLLIVRKLGGYTGTCLGGVEQMGELGALLGIALVF